jgi:hypothetical protein
MNLKTKINNFSLFFLLPILDIHVQVVHLYVFLVEQQDNHFHDEYVPLLSMHIQFDQLDEMENNINLDVMDVVMFEYPDQVVC